MISSFRNFALVDLAVVKQNALAYRKIIEQQCKLMFVFKANAYGHGGPQCSKACEDVADMFAVATLEEAKSLRDYGVKKPVLILGPTDISQIDYIVSNNIVLSVGDIEYAKEIEKLCKERNLYAHIHMKIDTGMNRTGLRCRVTDFENCIAQAREIYNMRHLIVDGTYTHFAVADFTDDDNKRFTQNQYNAFLKYCDEMSKLGYKLGLRHCSATGGTLLHPDMRLDMVRLGMPSLGQCISIEERDRIGLKTAMTWKARIVAMRDVPAGESISYNRMYITEKPTRSAVVSIGYADGYKQNYSNLTKILVNGQFAPLAGRVAMDYIIVDVTDIKGEVNVGDYVTLMGRDGDNEITAMELGSLNGCAPGEVTCSISYRVPRIYINE